MDWINISEKYPNPYEEVIICSNEGRVKSAIYVNNGKWNTFLNVVYWMPMPKAPEIQNVEVEQVKKSRGRPKKK